MVVKFPPVTSADESGLLAIGGDLEVPTLELAYRSGIFPWPVEGEPLLWFAPPCRAIIDFDEFCIPKRLRRYLKKANLEFRMDSDFTSVIECCAHSENRKGQSGTWITAEMINAYTRFHKVGFAHSFEAFDEKGMLIAGLYGVLIRNYFAGESMFHKEPHSSKFVLIQTTRFLQNHGITWMDVQILTPFLKSFGAKEIPRVLFMEELQKAIN